MSLRRCLILIFLVASSPASAGIFSHTTWSESIGVGAGTLRAAGEQLLILPVHLGFQIHWSPDLPVRTELDYVPRLSVNEATEKTRISHSFQLLIQSTFSSWMFGGGIRCGVAPAWLLPTAEVGFSFLRLQGAFVSSQLWETSLRVHFILGAL